MVMVRTLFAAIALALAFPAGAQARTDYGAYVAEASARFGIPVQWIWRVMAVESGGRAMLDGRPIRSPKGAIGLMQLMPGTWRAMRATYALGSDPDDPRDNILAGAAYLRLMYDRFGYPGLFGAYNAGPGRYGDYLRGRALPRETSDYLAATVGAALRQSSPTPASAAVSLFGIAPRATDAGQAPGTAPGDDLFAIIREPAAR
jgi:soluble lytic murein transglycosylase-like protein